MMLFPSVPSGLLFLAAAVLTVWGACVKNSRVLPFFAGVTGMLAILLALVDGAEMIQCLLYSLVFLLLGAEVRGRKNEF